MGLDGIREDLDSIEKAWREKRFHVAVLGIVKPGKSTLLNALLGAEDLSSSNTSETVRIVCIRHEPTAGGAPVLMKAGATIAIGITEVRDEPRSLNASE